jgi:hypothetical protein
LLAAISKMVFIQGVVAGGKRYFRQKTKNPGKYLFSGVYFTGIE